MNITTNPPSFELARDFLFSTVLNKLTVMSQGLLSTEEKKSLAKLTEQFKVLVGNDNTVQAVLSGNDSEKEETLNEIAGGDADNIAFFDAAIDTTISPPQDLLVRNRFIVLLRNRIEKSDENPVLQEALSIASMYFGDDIIRPATINAAADIALSSMSMRYHSEFIPTKDVITSTLFDLVDDAIKQQQNEPERRVVPDEYTPERLSGLRVNM